MSERCCYTQAQSPTSGIACFQRASWAIHNEQDGPDIVTYACYQHVPAMLQAGVNTVSELPPGPPERLIPPPGGETIIFDFDEGDAQ